MSVLKIHGDSHINTYIKPYMFKLFTTLKILIKLTRHTIFPPISIQDVNFLFDP